MTSENTNFIENRIKNNRVKKKEVKLKKELGYWDVTLATAGFIIGAGIFAIIGITAKYGKNFSWISVLICGLFASFTGLSYSELSSMFNQNGGEYIISKEAFNHNLAKIVAWFTIVTEILTLSSVSYGLGGYISTIVPFKEISIATVSLLGFGYLNYSGIRKSANYNNVSTILEIAGLLIIGFLGMSNIKKEQFDLTKIDNKYLTNIIVGAAFIYFAYFGFDATIELTEETKNSEETIPKAMLSGLGISTSLYLIVALSTVATIGWKALSESKSPMADVANHLLGGYGGKLMLGVAIISMSNTLLMGHIGSSRFLNSISRTIKLPFNLDKIDEKNSTPKNAIILVTVISMLGLLLGNLEKTVSVTNLGTLVIFFMVNLAVIVLRKKQPFRKRPFKIPFNIADIPISSVLGCISSILLMVYMIQHHIS